MLNSVVAVLLMSVSSDVAAAIPQCKSSSTVAFSKKVSFSLLLFLYFLVDRAIVYKRQNFLKVVVNVFITDQYN